MLPELIEDLTRARFESWARRFDAAGSTPALAVGVSRAEPDRVVLCLDPRMPVPELRRLLAQCLTELDKVGPGPDGARGRG